MEAPVVDSPFAGTAAGIVADNLADIQDRLAAGSSTAAAFVDPSASVPLWHDASVPLRSDAWLLFPPLSQWPYPSSSRRSHVSRHRSLRRSFVMWKVLHGWTMPDVHRQEEGRTEEQSRRRSCDLSSLGHRDGL